MFLVIIRPVYPTMLLCIPPTEVLEVLEVSEVLEGVEEVEDIEEDMDTMDITDTPMGDMEVIHTLTTGFYL